MEKINLKKYGFVRSPEDDFSDDGSRFTCYKVGKVRVSKLIYNDEAYIAGRLDDDAVSLPYEVYSNLPHYKALDALNGVSRRSITEEALQKLYEDCVSYQAEFEAAKANIKYPTLEEVKAQCEKVQAHYEKQYRDVEKILAKHALDLVLKLSDCRFKTLKNWVQPIENKAKKQYNPDNVREAFLHTAAAINFVKPDCRELFEHWYFDQVVEILQSCGIVVENS